MYIDARIIWNSAGRESCFSSSVGESTSAAAFSPFAGVGTGTAAEEEEPCERFGVGVAAGWGGRGGAGEGGTRHGGMEKEQDDVVSYIEMVAFGGKSGTDKRCPMKLSIDCNEKHVQLACRSPCG